MKESINNYTGDNESIKNSEKSIFSQPEEWMDSFYELYEDGRKHHNAPQSYIDYFKARQFLLTEIRKAEENAKTNLLREMKQMADKEVKISMVAGEIIQVRQLEVIQTVAKLHNIRL